MSSPYWVKFRDENADQWNTVTFGVVTLPGIVVDFSVNGTNVFDVAAAQGNTGASVTPKGRQPRKMTLAVRLRNQADWEQWHTTLSELNQRGPDAVQRPFSITHPTTAFMGIDSVYIETFNMPFAGAQKGMTFTFGLLENIPPKPVVISSQAKKVTSPKDFASKGFSPPGDSLS